MIHFLTTGTIINAVNVPSVTGELLDKLQPYLTLADRMGCLHAQLAPGPIEGVSLKYSGDFDGLEMAPATTAAIKGLLTPALKEMVNSINAPLIAKERGIQIVDSRSASAEDYTNLIIMEVTTAEGANTIAGTIFGKHEPRIIRINDFRLEVYPEGHLLLIHNEDKPGAIGSIGTVLGKHNVNIARMHVGQEKDGDRNIIFIDTDTPAPEDALKEVRDLPLIKSVIPLEL
jgi:D-3-phosphoglycerate dehydrogenase